MRLLNARSMEAELLYTSPSPGYAIVSHRWGKESEEVLYTDIANPARARSKPNGYRKVAGACAQAIRDGIDYVWLDTCCIDRSNNTELTESINSMYNWYRDATVCYVFLYDVGDPHSPSEFRASDWFSRVWTLQELIAPRVVKFFTKYWKYIGTRDDLKDLIADRTGISPDLFASPKIPPCISVSQRMIWAAERESTKIEDKSYAMLGILGITMYPIYGIGNVAFEDFQYRLIGRCSDQSLFSWYHIVTEPEDVEMKEPVPNPASSANPSKAAANATTEPTKPNPPLNTTGFLAPTHSQFLKSYEIPEREFRKNYLDHIQNYGYRSQFPINNGLVQICLPMKLVAGSVWKAVLRCSFDPPGGDQIQRPLVIYLREIDSPWKFARVHLMPEVAEGEEMTEGDVQTDRTKGVPGSLERLPDAEQRLNGFILRHVEVIVRYGDRSGKRPRQPQGDPRTLPEPSDVERIAHLPRHPPGTKTINILVCGEPGTGASRVVNFILGYTALRPLMDFEREPMEVTTVDATLASRHLRILYVTGMQDPYLDRDAYRTTLRHMRPYAQHVRALGGVHLVLFCMVGTPEVLLSATNNFGLFYEHFAHRVPVFVFVTGLGREREEMEGWWEQHVQRPELESVARCARAHACITVLRHSGAEDEVEGEGQARRHDASCEHVRALVHGFVERLDAEGPVAGGYCPEDLMAWSVSMARRTMGFLFPSDRRGLEPVDVKAALVEGWRLSEAEAMDILRQLFDGNITV